MEIKVQQPIGKDYTVNIGMRVTKGKSKALIPKQKRMNKWKPKAFKDGSFIHTVKGVIDHPHLHIPAFIFEDDDSYVECRGCRVFEGFKLKSYLE